MDLFKPTASSLKVLWQGHDGNVFFFFNFASWEPLIVFTSYFLLSCQDWANNLFMCFLCGCMSTTFFELPYCVILLVSIWRCVKEVPVQFCLKHLGLGFCKMVWKNVDDLNIILLKCLRVHVRRKMVIFHY